MTHADYTLAILENLFWPLSYPIEALAAELEHLDGMAAPVACGRDHGSTGGVPW